MNDLHRELANCFETGLGSLMTVLHRLESIPEADLTPDLRQWRDEQRAALREDLMKLTGDEDGQELGWRLRCFAHQQGRSDAA